MRRLILVLLCLALIASPASAKHNTNLFGYDDSTLRFWQGRYSSSMPKVLNLLSTTGMSSTQRASLRDVKFYIPLDARELPTSYGVAEPFVFFVERGSHTITMSVTSILFLDELTQAAAWLSENNCTFEPLADYMAMLQYRTPQYFGGHYPTPLQALGVPPGTFNDMDDHNTEVEKMALSFFNEARAFIIAHEAGHILDANPNTNSDAETPLQKEIRADTIAANALFNAEFQSVGMFITFFAWANYLPNRWDFKSEAAWLATLEEFDHPLTSDRMLALANTLQKALADNEKRKTDRRFSPDDRDTMRSIATEMVNVANLLTDSDIQMSIRIKRASTTLTDLQSRCAKNTKLPGDRAFQGTYTGEWLHHSREGVDKLPVTTTLKRTGDEVTGIFDFGLGPGSISGLIEGNTLYFSWQWTWIGGKGRFEVLQDGRGFDGIWGYNASDVNGGTWTGLRP